MFSKLGKDGATQNENICLEGPEQVVSTIVLNKDGKAKWRNLDNIFETLRYA